MFKILLTSILLISLVNSNLLAIDFYKVSKVTSAMKKLNPYHLTSKQLKQKQADIDKMKSTLGEAELKLIEEKTPAIEEEIKSEVKRLKGIDRKKAYNDENRYYFNKSQRLKR